MNMQTTKLNIKIMFNINFQIKLSGICVLINFIFYFRQHFLTTNEVYEIKSNLTNQLFTS